MSWVTIVWSMSAAVSLTLAAIQVVVWLQDRKSWANLLFSLMAMMVAGIALSSLGLMRVETVAQFIMLHRLSHVLLFFTIISIVGFILIYFRSGRLWLAGMVIGLRLVVLVLNFTSGASFNYRAVTGLVPFQFLGETISLPVTLPSPWARLGEGSALLLLVFVFDAAVSLWRRGSPDGRRKALVVGGSFGLFTFFSIVNAYVVHTGMVHAPYFISLFFVIIVVAMGYELSRDVIRAARMSEELRENAESMRLAAGAAQLVLWRWDVRDNVIWANAEGRRLYGVTNGEDISLQRFFDALHPDDREATRQAVTRCIESDDEFRVQYRVVLPDGQSRWFAAQGRSLDDGSGRATKLMGVSMDVTQQKQIQERFRLAVEASPNGVVLVDPQGNIALVNAQTERMFGYGREELIGQTIELLVPERFRSIHRDHRSGYYAAPAMRAMGAGRELFARRKDGSEFPVEIGISPIDSEEGTLILSAITDISARKLAEAESRRHLEELAHVTRVSTLSELSGSLAHELNQPLGIILSNAEAAQELLIQNPPDVAEMVDILSDIVKADRRAGEIIKRLRALLKRGEAFLQTFSLNDAIEEVLQLTYADLIGRGVTVFCNLSPDLPLITSDRVQLQQVVLNLILNAADAMSANAPGTRLIRLQTTLHKNVVRVSVRDEGSGLPEDVECLFQPFFTTKPKGLGMGLAIARSIIAAHHGRLWAEPHPERGAIFQFELPVAGSPDDP